MEEKEIVGMQTVYDDADYVAVIAQRDKTIHTFWYVTLGYLVFCLAWLAYYMSLPYNDPMQTLPKICVYVASVVYVIFAFPYLGIKYHRINRYYKMVYYLSEGLKNVEENYFVGFEAERTQKDYIDVYSCIFKTWNKKKCEWMEREAYFDAEKPLPDFQRGDLIRYIVQGNFIVQYDILQRGAIEDDDSEDVYVDEVIAEETV